MSLLRTLARADARRIVTTNTAQSKGTSAGDIKKELLAVNSSSASAEGMEKKTGQLFCQDANVIAKEDAKKILCCFSEQYNFHSFIFNSLSNITYIFHSLSYPT